MSIIEGVSDVNNTFLSRRELTCNFAGMGGRLGKLEAVDMVTKEFNLDGKLVIPMRLKNHVGRPMITGTFFVYDDENLAKSHVNPSVFSRLEKAKKARDEAAAQSEDAKEPETKSEDKPEEAKSEDKPAETKSEDKPEEAKSE